MPEANDAILEFQCPKCAKRLKAGTKIAGRRVKCPKCGQTVKVPGAPHQNATTDDQWLSLDGPAISDVENRKEAADKVREEKDRKRQQVKRKKEANTLPNTKASSKSMANSQASDKGIPSSSGRSKTTPSVLAKSSSAQGAASAKTAGTSAESPTKRSVFDDDLPELEDLEPGKKHDPNIDQLLASHADGTAQASDVSNLDDLIPDVGGAQSLSEISPLYVEEDVEEEKDPEYRIACKTCGTHQYVKLSAKGMKIKCPDCFSEFKIPAPPPGWKPKSKKKKVPPVSTEPDVELAPPEQLQNAQTAEAQKLRATKILERAESDISESDIEKLYDGDFDTAGFVKRTFGFVKDPITMSQIAGYGVVFALLFALAQYSLDIADTDFGKGLILLTAISGPIVAMLFALPMLSGGLALIESVANREPKVTEWPAFNLFDNVGDVIAITMSLTAAMLPGFFIGVWLSNGLEHAGRVHITAMMVSTFGLFPVFLLSMLDNGSVFQPVSQSIVKSFTEAAEAWGGYFLKTLVAFFLVAVLWYVLLGKHPMLSGAAGFLFPFLVFFTCQQIGALADSISDHLSFDFEPSSEKSSDVTSTESATDGAA